MWIRGFRLGWMAAMATAAVAQINSVDLHSRYAQPLREEMQARPGISITVLYGLDQQACEIRIHPTTTSILVPEPATFMVPETVTDIIDEVAPPDERGTAVGQMIEFAGCNELRRDEYENVTITRLTHECLPLQPAREESAFIRFINPRCAGSNRAQRQP